MRLRSGWTERSISKMAHSHGYGREASVPDHVCHSRGLLEYPHDMAASFPQSKCSTREQGGSHGVFHDLVSEATHHYFCNILVVTQVGPFIVGEDHVRV